MSVKLFNLYIAFLNMKRGASFYFIILIALQIISLILVIPDLIPSFDKFLIVFINLSYLMVFVLSIKLSILFYIHFKERTKLLRIFSTLFSICSLFIWVSVTYSLTSLAIGQGILGPKLVAEYKIEGYDKNIYIYRNILLDTSIIIKENSGYSPIMKYIYKIDNSYGYIIKAYRFSDKIEFRIDSLSYSFDLSSNRFEDKFKEKLSNNCAYQELYRIK